jgi:hypothetical protein
LDILVVAAAPRLAAAGGAAGGGGGQGEHTITSKLDAQEGTPFLLRIRQRISNRPWRGTIESKPNAAQSLTASSFHLPDVSRRKRRELSCCLERGILRQGTKMISSRSLHFVFVPQKSNHRQKGNIQRMFHILPLRLLLKVWEVTKRRCSGPTLYYNNTMVHIDQYHKRKMRGAKEGA